MGEGGHLLDLTTHPSGPQALQSRGHTQGDAPCTLINHLQCETPEPPLGGRAGPVSALRGAHSEEWHPRGYGQRLCRTTGTVWGTTFTLQTAGNNLCPVMWPGKKKPSSREYCISQSLQLLLPAPSRDPTPQSLPVWSARPGSSAFTQWPEAPPTIKRTVLSLGAGRLGFLFPGGKRDETRPPRTLVRGGSQPPCEGRAQDRDQPASPHTPRLRPSRTPSPLSKRRLACEAGGCAPQCGISPLPSTLSFKSE